MPGPTPTDWGSGKNPGCPFVLLCAPLYLAVAAHRFVKDRCRELWASLDTRI